MNVSPVHTAFKCMYHQLSIAMYADAVMRTAKDTTHCRRECKHNLLAQVYIRATRVLEVA